MKVPDHVKSFLLGSKNSEFASFIKKDRIKPTEFNELTLVKTYLNHGKLLAECFFDSELPRLLQESCHLLLKSMGILEKIAFTEKKFKKDWIDKNGPLNVLSCPFYIRDKFFALDSTLRNQFQLKIFLVLQKKVSPPHEVGSVGCYFITLRKKDIEFVFENEDCSIGDLRLLEDDLQFQSVLANGYRYLASRRMQEIANAISNKHYSPEKEKFLLGDGAIAIFQSLYPQMPLISFSNQEWNNSTIRIIEVKNEKLVLSDRVDYGLYLWDSFLNGRPFNNIALVINNARSIKLLVKFSQQAAPLEPFSDAEVQTALQL